MHKLTFKKRLWVVKQMLKGISTEKLCRTQGISRMTVSNLVRRFKEDGWDCLKDRKTGRPGTVLHPAAVTLVVMCTPFLQGIFELSTLGVKEWLICLQAAFLQAVFTELIKYMRRRISNPASKP